MSTFDMRPTEQDSAVPYIIYSDPNALYEEITYRLEYYNKELERLREEQNRITLLRDVLGAAQNAFDKQQNSSFDSKYQRLHPE